MLTKLSVTTLAALLMPGMFGPSNAGDIEATSGVGSCGSFSCITIWCPASNPYIRTVSHPATAQGDTEVAERDRKWVARVIPSSNRIDTASAAITMLPLDANLE